MGKLGNTPEIREIGQKSTKLCEFSVAVADYYNGEQQTYWITCQAWGRTAENIQKFFEKGDTIGVQGKLVNSSYTSKDGHKVSRTYVMVQSWDFGGKKKNESAVATMPTMPEQSGIPTSDDFVNIPSGMSEEMPF